MNNKIDNPKKDITIDEAREDIFNLLGIETS